MLNKRLKCLSKKKHIAYFMIEFKALAMKTETNNIYVIFLLKKNVRSNIIKIILGYLSIVALKTLKEQNIAITSVRQEYESIEERQNYRTGSEITYGGRGAPINIGKSKNNYKKNKKPKYFNYNVYRHIVKDC